ncbi:MAG: hypothetical protein DHS20C01_14050 [marine bacterium B5-7]|nr:MAG: hypothetical protein DHS20C01_14050 [marine bacterium B5-7]
MYILSAMAILIHYPIIALFIAVYLANRWPSAAPAFLISAIVLGFGAPWVLNIFGFELAAIVKYSGYTEGSYHYLKLAVHLVVAGFILILVRFVLHRKLVLFESVYLYCVGVASLLVLYEVPFERLLLYGEMIIPFMLPGLLLVERLSARAMIGLWATGMVLGILLWTNRSIEITLGYAT